MSPRASTRKHTRDETAEQDNGSKKARVHSDAETETTHTPTEGDDEGNGVDGNNLPIEEPDNREDVSDTVLRVSMAPAEDPLMAASPEYKIQDLGYLPGEFIRSRLSKAVRFTDEAASHYPLATVPLKQTSWGGTNENYLYIGKNRVLVGMVVRLLETRLEDVETKKGGNDVIRKLKMRPAIRFKFLRDADAAMAGRIVYEMSYPPIKPTRRSFWSGALSTKTDGKKAIAKPYEFVYDGTVMVTTKAKMKKIDAKTLRPNDILYVEATINRFEGKKDKTDVDEYGADVPWVTWRNNLELFSITKLFSPRHGEAPNEPDSGDERSQVRVSEKASF